MFLNPYVAGFGKTSADLKRLGNVASGTRVILLQSRLKTLAFEKEKGTLK